MLARGRRVSFDGQGLVRPARTGRLELDAEYEEHRPGEDVATLIHPADYGNVLAVNATMTGYPEAIETARRHGLDMPMSAHGGSAR